MRFVLGRFAAVACWTLFATVAVAPSADASPAARSIALEVVSDDEHVRARAMRFVHHHGGTVDTTASNVLSVSLPSAHRRGLEQIAPVRTPARVDVRPESIGAPSFPQFGSSVGEHAAVLGAPAWHDAGFTGAGVTIGVIDFFDVGLFWDESEHGPLPVAQVSARCFDRGDDCTDEFFDGANLGGEDHGVAVVEAIRDVAPDATILIGQATTLADYSSLISWFADNDVDIVNRSLGSRYDGPGDGRGALNEIVETATAQGMLWVNSAGNSAGNRYYRHEVRLAENRVAFGPSGDQTFLEFNSCISLGGIRWANDWDLPPEDRTDYDAFIWESPDGDPTGGSVIASSTLDQTLGAPPIETFSTSRCPTSGSTLYLELQWNSGDTAGDVIEILDYGSGMKNFTSAPSSAAVSVVDSTDRRVIAVGAVDPADSGSVGFYSSQGPSNDGRILPDLVAPANFTSTVFGRFAGTSAAAGGATGIAALLLDADLATDTTTLADLIRHTVIDRGPVGDDNQYGNGELRLPAPPLDLSSQASVFRSLDIPTRFLDTRPASAKGPAPLIGATQPGDLLRLPVSGVGGIPTDDVTAVAVNIVSTGADAASFLQALPTAGATVGGYSNVNIDGPGQTRSNFAIVPVGTDGSISIYTIAAGHVVVDVLGWFEASADSATSGRFVELDQPERTLDTRLDPSGEPLLAGDMRNVPMPEGLSVANAQALVITLTAADPSAAGWLQAIPGDRTDIVGSSSTVNTTNGSAVANTAIVPVGPDGIAIAAFFADGGHGHAIVDVIGYITSEQAPSAQSGRYVAVRPSRAYDSRTLSTPLHDREDVIVDASDALGVSVPDSASAVIWNAAIVNSTRPGFMRTWAADQAEPATSSLNWSFAGEVRAGAVISAVDSGRSRFQVSDGGQNLDSPVGNIIADVFGYFT